MVHPGYFRLQLVRLYFESSCGGCTLISSAMDLQLSGLTTKCGLVTQIRKFRFEGSTLYNQLLTELSALSLSETEILGTCKALLPTHFGVGQGVCEFCF